MPSREEIEDILRTFVEDHLLVRRLDQLEGFMRQDIAAADAQIALLRDRVARLEGARESDTIHTGNTGRFRLSEMPQSQHGHPSFWPRALVGILKPIAIPVAAAVGGFITHWLLKH